MVAGDNEARPSTGALVNPRWRELVLEHDELAELDPAQRRLALRGLLGGEVGETELGHAVSEVADEIDGFGPLSALLSDESVTDVLVNGAAEVWVERDGTLVRSEVGFGDAARLEAWIERVLGGAGARADVGRPIADARLANGARMHVVLPPIARAGPLVSIRRFPPRRPSLADLRRWGTLDADQERLLENAVGGRVSIVVTGPTGSGKTTLVNALLGLVDETERVVIVEEVAELSPACRHWVALVSRPPNIEGSGAVEPLALVRCALRMRPDRIVVGEVRGPEALAALAAMSTGHRGSMVTLHANSAAEAVDRMVTLALQARSGASHSSLTRTFRDAFGLVVHVDKGPGGRRVKEIVAPG
jgi:pilus assembly protein CpaF